MASEPPFAARKPTTSRPLPHPAAPASRSRLPPSPRPLRAQPAAQRRPGQRRRSPPRRDPRPRPSVGTPGSRVPCPRPRPPRPRRPPSSRPARPAPPARPAEPETRRAVGHRPAARGPRLSRSARSKTRSPGPVRPRARPQRGRSEPDGRPSREVAARSFPNAHAATAPTWAVDRRRAEGSGTFPMAAGPPLPRTTRRETARRRSLPPARVPGPSPWRTASRAPDRRERLCVEPPACGRSRSTCRPPSAAGERPSPPSLS